MKIPLSTKKATAQTVASDNIIPYVIFRFHERISICRFHELRHSHVSLCIEHGYSIVLVAKRIGDTVPVVMRTYAHLYPNKQQELVSKLEAIGSPTSNNDDSDLMSLG